MSSKLGRAEADEGRAGGSKVPPAGSSGPQVMPPPVGSESTLCLIPAIGRPVLPCPPPMEHEKARRRRIEILKSAAAAFRRRGYHGASMGEIAQALHMTKGSLYYYFRNKEEILFFCHDYSLDVLLDVLDRVEGSGGSPAARLRSLIESFVH